MIEIKREEVGILRVCDEEGNQFRRYIVKCWVLDIHVLDISRRLNHRREERGERCAGEERLFRLLYLLQR